MKPEAREKLEGLMKKFEEEERRYNVEKKDIEREAKKLEHERDIWQARDPYFLFAEALLQIAIVMSSVSILSRSGAVFSFSLLLAVAGTLLTVNGFFSLFHLPLMPGGH
jgi:fatty acid desaturase